MTFPNILNVCFPSCLTSFSALSSRLSPHLNPPHFPHSFPCCLCSTPRLGDLSFLFISVTLLQFPRFNRYLKLNTQIWRVTLSKSCACVRTRGICHSGLGSFTFQFPPFTCRFHFSSPLKRLPLCLGTAFSLCLRQQMGIWAASTSWLLWVEQQWTWMSICLSVRM